MDNLYNNIHKNIKNNTTNAGIYKINCITNNRFYIGSSLHINTRIRTHFNHLRKNKHLNKSLQNSFNKYGESSFIVECIESVDKDINYNDLILLEQKYLDTLKPWNEKIGFNNCKIAAKPPSRTGAVFTEEHKRNIANARRGKKHPHSYQTPVILQNINTNEIVSKTQFQWRQLKVDACALLHNRQETSKGWKLYSSFNPP
jgi:group I intron endonuclease